jgi:TetR/AcrR family transcriptional regulator, cholesterol catabolism regulator
MDLFRTIFEPWEQHPLMLRSYFRARSEPGGKRLIQRGLDAVLPVARAVMAQLGSGFARDPELILTGVGFGFLGRFTEGEIDVTELVPGIERAVFRLTAAYDANPPRRLEPR